MNLDDLVIYERETRGFNKIIVRLNGQMLDKIYDLIPSSARYFANQLDAIKQNSQEPYEIPSEDIADILIRICKNNDNETKMHINSTLEYMDEYIKVLERYKDFRKIDEYSPDELCTDLFFDANKMKSFIEISSELQQERKKRNVIRDLSNAKSDISLNLKYFLSNDAIQQFENQYEMALNEKNINAMQQMLDTMQQLILDHWREYVTSIENFKQGDKFKFICHSTNFTDFTGAFRTKYVSTSLLSEDVMGTFRSGFGFVFAPENIVGAKSKDMYVNNSAENEDEMLYYSTIKKIDSPERLIEECIEQKEENKKNDKDKEVYNEVILDGFNPIAIFCLTDGSMELNNNYNCANELKKHFPNLNVIQIDMTYYKKEEELLEIKKDLIQKLMNKIVQDDSVYSKLGVRERQMLNVVNDEVVLKYDLFWNQFMKMKKERNFNYTSDDIFNLFMKHYNLVNGITPLDTISHYTEDEIRLFLSSNYSLNSDMFKGNNLNGNNLQKVSEIYPYIKNCEFSNDLKGLQDLCEVLKYESEIDYSLLRDKLKTSNVESLLQFASVIASNISENVKSNKDKLLRLSERKQYYDSELQKFNGKINEYEECSHICDMEYLYTLASNEIKYNNDDIIRLQENIKVIEERLKTNEQRLLELKKQAKQKEDEKNKNSEYRSRLERKIADLDKQISELRKSKLKFLHKKKIDELFKEKNKLSYMLYENNANILDFISDNTDIEITILENNINYDKRQIEEDKNKIVDKTSSNNESKNQFESKTGIKYEEYMSKLEYAKKIVNSFDMYSIRKTINNLSDAIGKIEQQINMIEQQHSVGFESIKEIEDMVSRVR